MADGHGGQEPLGVLRAVIVAAEIFYRDILRRYKGEQAEAVASGVRLEEPVTRNWGAFADAVRAGERLFALLDTWEKQEAVARDEVHKANRGS